ncbi:39S ribosomal protein L20 like protein [Argiope bruennichi]|uniref:39S ribosomal protein L20 like protein n=1 Tax=Argiope bruennichi TaxID=94029 RepID=A0A8T0FS33_ARGBR|nr:39S ribosomal protein L20 like protein [Argiope bruennichi]
MINYATKRAFDKSFKRQKILKLTAKYFGRKRNCYSIAIKFLQKALKYTTVGRKIKPAYLYQLRSTRVGAAALEHELDYFKLTQNLTKSGLQLKPVDLQDLAIWEPRTFKCLSDIAKAKEKLDANPEVGERLQIPENVITRGML